MNSDLAPAPAPAQLPRSLATAIASLVLGILAVMLSFLLLGAVLGVAGAIVGFVHLRQGGGLRNMARWGLGLSVVGILASIAFGCLYFVGFRHLKDLAPSADESSVAITEWVGALAPDFSVTTLDGQKVTLSELRGKRVVVDFWATWCPPCVREIPHFIDLFKETSRDDLVVVGISSEDAATLKPFVKQKGIPYPIASAADLAAPYSDVRSIPTTFFIDRRGVIQEILVGYDELADLRKHALAKDSEGEPKPPPAPLASGLKESEHPLKPVELWQTNLTSAASLAVGDWDSDGESDLLVTDKMGRLHVLALSGAPKGQFQLAEKCSFIELGRHREQGPRLLGYSNWGKQVSVMDRAGKLLWSYKSAPGIDGAHWGDLDGDGTDELIIGMNGGGGLHAVSPDGKLLWRDANIGNVWNQAVIPARTGQPAVIFATEAGGTVRVYDASGKLLRTLRPNNQYCAQMTAAVIDGDGTVQGIAVGDHARVLAFDPEGKLAWSTATLKGPGNWRSPTFAAGDVDGDGKMEWAFLEASGDLVCATANGEKLASLPAQKGIDGFVMASDAKRKGLLVTLTGGDLKAYGFE